MTCTACAAAEADPQTGRYNAHCDACTVRAVAQSPQHFESRKAGQITPGYRAMLEKLFGADWQAGHERVKVWQSSRGNSNDRGK